MKPKMIFFDIDGTLLSEKTGKIPDSAIEAIRIARENGHFIFINTGRCYSFLPKEILELDVDGYVCGCGTNVFCHGEELLHISRTMDFARSLRKDMKAWNIETIYEGKYTAYMEDLEELRFPDFRYFRTQKEFKVASVEQMEYPIDKMYVCTDETSDFASFEKKYKDVFEIIDRENRHYEIIPLGYSKSTGIQLLMDKFCVDLEDTISVGDSNNDLAMLEYTGVSIAMGNSSPQILNRVDYVTSDVDEDGIYQALKHYALI
ncbi:MAG: Cof-type HAD-IIB family hydrolase [Lachnospiraceae bacterium]|nr:Cof-type HAD-IIB family hydrolase [Lachnospiraceae bacterium]